MNWIEVLSLAKRDGTSVSADVMSGSGLIYPRAGIVANLRPETSECDIGGRTLRLSQLLRVRFPDGRVVESPRTVARHEQLMREREDAKQEIQRLRTDDTFVLAQHRETARFIDEIPATLDEKPTSTYAFTQGTKKHFVVVLGKSKEAAQRAMDVMLNISFWDAAGILLKAGVLWTHWHLLRAHCAERAAEIRRDLPVLGPDDSFDRIAERTALYAAAGLSENVFGPWVDTGAMEVYGYDWLSLFSWFENKPTDLATQFFAKAWQSREFIEEPDEALPASVLDAMVAHGLAAVLPPMTVPELLSRVRIADLRQWVADAGSNFKAQSGQKLREHLLQLAPSFLESRLHAFERGPRHQLLTPPGMSWREFQNFRQDYRTMVELMLQWLYLGQIAIEADNFYRPKVAQVPLAQSTAYRPDGREGRS